MVEEPVGESLSADTDALQDTIASQLVEDKVSIDEARPLHLVGDDAADKVGCCIAEGGHEMVQGRLVVLPHGDEASSLLASGTLTLSEVVTPEGNDEGIRGLLEQFNDRIIQWIFVLIQPSNDSIANLQVC